MERRIVLRSEFTEWTENPITQLVLEALRRKIDACYENRANYLLPGDAHSTQEYRMKLLGEEDAYETIKGLIELGESEIEDLFTSQNIEVIGDRLDDE
jgi:hypothetical protein